MKLIRDADKIDILYLYTTKEIDLDIDKEEFSDKTYNSLINKKNIARVDITNKTDRLAVSLGFIYDINYNYSFKYLNDVDYYNKIINIFKEKTKDSKLNEQLEEIRKVINNYIEENVYVRQEI